MPAAINAISSNQRQNTPCPSARARLNGREQARDSMRAKLFDRRRNRHAQNTDDIFHACRQPCGADVACQRAISRSCTARTGASASRISATANYRIATDLHVSEVWRDGRTHEIAFRTVPLASARSRPVIGFHGVRRFIQTSPVRSPCFACGAAGFKAEKPGELREAIDQGLKADGPAIIDCVVPANELPNVPHIEPKKVANVAKAKIKEAIIAVTGG
jgi:hypothetical protein